MKRVNSEKVKIPKVASFSSHLVTAVIQRAAGMRTDLG